MSLGKGSVCLSVLVVVVPHCLHVVCRAAEVVLMLSYTSVGRSCGQKMARPRMELEEEID